MKETERKDVYEAPVAEIVEFTTDEHIASSANYGSDTICGEELFD